MDGYPRVMVDEPTQPTRPAKGDPVEIPVPKRSAWDKVLRKAARPSIDDLSDEEKAALVRDVIEDGDLASGGT